MNATTALESTPPDRNAPIGTSLTICMPHRFLEPRAHALDPCRFVDGRVDAIAADRQ